MSTKIIAEAGVNHNGSIDMAMQLIDVACEAGADFIKFQTFKAENLVVRGTEKAEYQKNSSAQGSDQYEMLKKLELTDEEFALLYAYCKKKKIEFLSTPFDLGSLDFLVNKLHLSNIKISSGDLTNGPLLMAAAKSGSNIILSTGMSDLFEIQQALSVICFAYIDDLHLECSTNSFNEVYLSNIGSDALINKVSLLHCTTEYPAPLEEVNLLAMNALRELFHLSVGYSDHTQGVVVPVAAAALGASIIEKHFTLDKKLPGPDHKASLEPKEFRSMVRSIREVETSLGGFEKKPTLSELKNITIARKSIVASKQIKIGEYFSKDNVTVKRPGNGLSPMEYWDIIGKRSKKNYNVDELVK